MIAAHPIGELEFKGCRVPAEDMVGAEGDGFLLAMRTMDTFRASVGAAACGMARRALDEAVRYASTRKQFGRFLAEHQLIQEKLADMVTELDAARLLVYRAAHLKDTGPRASLAKQAKQNSMHEAACRSSIRRCRFTAARDSCAAAWWNGSIETCARCEFTKALLRFRN